MPCPHCQAEVAPSDVYCISCGARLVPVHEAETVIAGRRPEDGDLAPPTSQEDGTAAVPRRRRRWAVVLVALLVNLALLAASAWLVYAALARYSERSRPSLTLGAARLVRVAPRPADATSAAAPAAPAPSAASAERHAPVVGAHARHAPERPSAVPGRRVTARAPAAAAGQAPAVPAVPAAPAPAASAPSSGSAAPPTSRPAAAESTPSAESAADQLRAGLDAESVRMVVQHHLPQVRACYDRALKQRDPLRGEVEIQFEVSAEGKVGSAAVYRNTTGHDGLGKCIAVVLRGWRFPRPVGGDVVFIYPFLFASGK